MFNYLKIFKVVKHQYKQNQAFAFFRVTHPLIPRLCGGVMFYGDDYPDAASLGFQETDRQLILFFVLPTP